MSYEISFGLLEDISRVTTVQQAFMLKIESYNHTVIESPSVDLRHPTWDYQYILAGSQKQIIKFNLCTLHPDYYMQVLATGKLDFRDYVARNKPGNSFTIHLPLDSSYNNEVILHLKCKHRQESRSRNQGLKQIQRPSSIKNKLKNQSKLSNQNQKIVMSSKSIQQDKQGFFKGACQTRNLFSFLDPVFKGQSFKFIQPVKK